MSGDSVQVVFQTTEGLKDAVGKWASDHNLAMSDVWRAAAAAYIEYDGPVEDPRTRTPKYATAEEQKTADYERAALVRWGKTTSARLLGDGQIEAATLVARAVTGKDYDTLRELKKVGDEIKAANAAAANEEPTTDE